MRVSINAPKGLGKSKACRNLKWVLCENAKGDVVVRPISKGCPFGYVQREREKLMLKLKSKGQLGFEI